jgi:Fur family transcriptional regulator, ferric uptake regulator
VTAAAQPSGPAGPRTDASDGELAWAGARAALRARGLRWTPQRRLILEVLAETSGHITGSEVVDRCRARDAETTPSTVYRTLDVLEELGYLRHSHGADGREEYHVLPATEHAHLRCLGCGASWEIEADEARELVDRLGTARGFDVTLSHVSIGGYCRGCGPTDAGHGAASQAPT